MIFFWGGGVQTAGVEIYRLAKNAWQAMHAIVAREHRKMHVNKVFTGDKIISPVNKVVAAVFPCFVARCSPDIVGREVSQPRGMGRGSMPMNG